MSKKIAVVTDSNSGITQKEAKELGLFVLPMPFMIDDAEYFEDISLTQEGFYTMLEGGASVVTSQPSPDSVMKLWDDLLADYEELVYIPMSQYLYYVRYTCISEKRRSYHSCCRSNRFITEAEAGAYHSVRKA